MELGLWDVTQTSLSSKSMCWKQKKKKKKIGKHKDLFDKGQIAMTRWMDQGIFKTAALVGCSWSPVVGILNWSKDGAVMDGQDSLMHVGTKG